MPLVQRERDAQDVQPTPAPAVPAHSVAPAITANGKPSLPGGLARGFSSLAIPNFRLLWFGTLFAMAAMQMDIVARAWLAYDLSGSALTLGVVSFARALPTLLLSLIGGVAADRFDKRRLIVVSQASLGLIALVNAVLVHLGVVEVWHLAVLGLLQGTVFSFNMPARQAYVPELVGADQLPNALAVTSTGMNANRVLAPVIAGILIAWNPAVAFYAVALLYGGAVLTIRRLPPSGAAVTRRSGMLAEVFVGLRYIWSRPVVRALMGMAFIPVLLGMPFQQLLPIFQADVLHVGPPELGVMYAAVGIGSLVGSLAIAYLSHSSGKGRIQLAAGVGFGVSLVCFALSGVYALSVALLLVVGLTSQGFMTINSTLVLLNTDREVYGRVMSVYLMTWSFVPLSMLPIGALVDHVGAPATVAAAGVMLALLIAAIGARYPASPSPTVAPRPA
ncbi:MAG: MFS transporter [Chloroflexi bacterium]|nr:MFS transporter [Chloroflexota bacterium]